MILRVGASNCTERKSSLLSMKPGVLSGCDAIQYDSYALAYQRNILLIFGVDDEWKTGVRSKRYASHGARSMAHVRTRLG
jgi:hypothetical protein